MNKKSGTSKAAADKLAKSIRRTMPSRRYTIHGLRYYAAHQLAESGCTDAQIAAITGHKSVEMVAKYSRKAAQRSLARAAQEKRSV